MSYGLMGADFAQAGVYCVDELLQWRLKLLHSITAQGSSAPCAVICV